MELLQSRRVAVTAGMSTFVVFLLATLFRYDLYIRIHFVRGLVHGRGPFRCVDVAGVHDLEFTDSSFIFLE